MLTFWQQAVIGNVVKINEERNLHVMDHSMVDLVENEHCIPKNQNTE